MSQHALLSPSSAERWMTCAGAPAMERGLPDESSKYSDEGTAAHLLGSTCLQRDTDPQAYKGHQIHVGSSEGFDGAVWGADMEAHQPFDGRGLYIVDDEMIEAVGRYVDKVREYAAGGILMAEQRVSIAHLTGEAEAEGTSDAVVTLPGELQVHDLKYGMGVKVSAIRNRQLMIYALGVLAEQDFVYGPFERVRLVVHQPRLDWLSEWDCTLEELVNFGYGVSIAAGHALEIYHGNAVAQLVPSEDGCRWCKAKATCPALAQFVLDQTSGDFTEVKSFPIAQGRLRQEEPEQLSLKMKSVGLVEDWCKAVRAEIERQLFAGTAIPGFKIVQGKKGNRQWTNKDAAEGLLKKMRLKLEEMYKMTLESPPAIEKLLKPQPRRWARVLKAGLIEQREGQPSVAPESDPRPVWRPPDPVNDFSAVEESLI